jgi:integrase
MASVVIKTLSTGERVYYANVKRDEKWTRVPTGIEAKGPRSEKLAQAWANAKQKEIDEEAKRDPVPEVKLCGPLVEEWIKSLANRAKQEDEWRARKYLLPRFATLPVRSITKGEVVKWLDELARTKKVLRKRDGKASESADVLSGASRKKLFTLLSRFLSWACAREYVEANACKAVPTLERPQADGERKTAWLSDPAKVQAMCWCLGPNFGLMFATARVGGMRLCEVVGLRVGDTDWLEDGVLHVQHSYDVRMLKEDTGRSPNRKEKWSPCHDATVAASLLALAKRRREAGASESDRLFDHLPKRPGTIRQACSRAWHAAAKAVGGVDGLGWYESRRHSFASQALANGARYEEVSKALGHATVDTTARFYDRHRERSFASLPSTDIGAPLPEPAKVLQLRRVS